MASKLIKKSVRKFDTTILRPEVMLCNSFMFVSFDTIEKRAVKERHGRAGSSRISVLHRKRITFCSMNHIAFFIPRLGCHLSGTKPTLRRGSHRPKKNWKTQKGREKIQIFILSFTHLLIHSLVFQERCHRIGCGPVAWRHRSGYTQAPPTGPQCTSGVPPEAPGPFLHRIESVSRSTLYQSYCCIGHSPPYLPIPTHPLCFL